MSILLVTGSRSLAKIEGAREWVLTILSAQVDHTSDGTQIVMGDATGPDSWARIGYTSRVYEAQSGRIVSYRPNVTEIIGSWSLRVAMFSELTAHQKPLYRNREMVADVAALKYGPAKVLAFIDPASKTQGTQHTIVLARKVGLTVTEHKWGVT